MNILGISSFYHDSAACVLVDGDIVAAAQEERFTRKKHDADFPINAINYCLDEAGINIKQIDCISFYDKPFLKFERILETYFSYAPKGIRSFLKSMPIWIKNKLWIKLIIQNELEYDGKILFPEHHLSHAASSCFVSNFKESAFLTMDGVGEWTTCSWGICKDNNIKIMAEIEFPNSLGLLYSAFTYYTGFKVNSGEYKLMGLAPYGKPKYKDIIYKHLIDVKSDGSFKMNMDYFDYCVGLKMTNSRFNKLFDGPPREPESKITQREMDIASSIQKVTEEIVIKIAKYVKQETGMKNLCLAGGVALNCVSNGNLLKKNLFKDIYIQPASGDAGGAIGSALLAWHSYYEKPRNYNNYDKMQGSYLGPEYDNKKIANFLNENNYPYKKLQKNDLCLMVAEHLCNQKIIGWFQGRMEFGPRALGNRSILGDPRIADMQKKMNLKIKYRESFRPFAPSIRLENLSEYFDLNKESPYMLLVAKISSEQRLANSNRDDNSKGFEKLSTIRSTLPAITHVDFSARVQTVNKKTNLLYHELITKFYNKTNCPVIVNTSFNVRGEPIVCSPIDAYVCFMRTEMDYLVLGNYILEKNKQPVFSDNPNWKKEIPLD